MALHVVHRLRLVGVRVSAHPVVGAAARLAVAAVTAVLDAPVRPTVMGSTTPRLYTRPMVTGPPGPCGCGCSLTPATSKGFAFERFVREIVGLGLLPYQRWLAIHMLELRPDGMFRFRRVLILISRQNGKTFYVKLLSLFMLYLGGAKLVLGAAQSLDIAREAWAGAVDIAKDVDDLAAEIEIVRYANGEQCLTLLNGARYRITAATRGAGRGLSVDMLVLDELREHRDWAAWSALSKTTTARPNHLIVMISNAGDDQSVVLNTMRNKALAADTDDTTLGLFEYSAPDGCELGDVEALAMANPALGHPNGITLESLLSAMATDPPTTFRTESMCQHVDALDAAIDLASWGTSADKGNLSAVRDRVAACVDVAPDGAHVTLAGAAVLDDGKVRVEVFGAWPTVGDARYAIPDLLQRIRPAAVGWFPNGPAAALGTTLRDLEAVELKGAEVAEACQEFAALVVGGQIRHPNDQLLNAHVAGSARLHTGDGWRFARKGTGHVDGAYAVAGAVRLARTLPEPERHSRPICV